MDDKLIYDIGYHRGEDTSHYLEKGYRVIAVEANPLLANQGQQRFKNAIKSGQLHLLNLGIGQEDNILEFWVNDTQSEWSSFDKNIGCRNNTRCHAEMIQCVPLYNLFAKYGVPFYLKIDIEGNDIYCLQQIDPNNKPKYVSCEACHLDWLTLLHEKGYTKFKMINQFDGFHAFNPVREGSLIRIFRNRLRWFLIKRIPSLYKFQKGASGFFAEETDGPWHNYESIRDAFLAWVGPDNNKQINNYSWFDFHATD
jgi:FkbM family methyltransferase